MSVRNFGPSTSTGACSSEIAGVKDTSAESSAEESSPKKRRTALFGTSDRALARDAAHMAVVTRMTDLFKAAADLFKEGAAPSLWTEGLAKRWKKIRAITELNKLALELDRMAKDMVEEAVKEVEIWNEEMEVKELTEKDVEEKEKQEKVMQKKFDAIAVEGDKLQEVAKDGREIAADLRDHLDHCPLLRRWRRRSSRRRMRMRRRSWRR